MWFVVRGGYTVSRQALYMRLTVISLSRDIWDLRSDHECRTCTHDRLSLWPGLWKGRCQCFHWVRKNIISRHIIKSIFFNHCRRVQVLLFYLLCTPLSHNDKCRQRFRHSRFSAWSVEQPNVICNPHKGSWTYHCSPSCSHQPKKVAKVVSYCWFSAPRGVRPSEKHKVCIPHCLEVISTLIVAIVSYNRPDCM